MSGASKQEAEFFTNLMVKHLTMTDEQAEAAHKLACEFYGPLDLEAVSVHWLAALFVKGDMADCFSSTVEAECVFAIALSQSMSGGIDGKTLDDANAVARYTPLDDIHTFSLLATLQEHVSACDNGAAMLSSYPVFGTAKLCSIDDETCVQIATTFSPPSYRATFSVHLAYGAAPVVNGLTEHSETYIGTLIDMAGDYREWAYGRAHEHNKLTAEGAPVSVVMH